MHPSTVKVAAALRTLGVASQVTELPEPAPTAASAAAQLGCDVGAIPWHPRGPLSGFPPHPHPFNPLRAHP